MKCTDCYDFCLPEYGIERDYIRDESFLNIVRRDCFYMFVPEWRGFAQGYSNQQQNNRETFEEYYQKKNNSPFNQQSAWQQQQNTMGGSIGQGINRVVGQLENVASSIVNNPGGALQKAGSQIGDQLESRWISLQTAPRINFFFIK